MKESYSGAKGLSELLRDIMQEKQRRKWWAWLLEPVRITLFILLATTVFIINLPRRIKKAYDIFNDLIIIAYHTFF